MKLSTLSLLAATVITLSSASHASNFTASHDHDHSEMDKDTVELNIYDSVNELMEERLEKSKNMDKTFDKCGPNSEPFLCQQMRYPTFPHPAAENQTALATVHNGQPIVLWGPNAAAMLGQNVMGFVMQHEYAHHDLRHLWTNNVPSAVKEADADCYAAKKVVQLGLQRIIPDVVRSMQAQGCNYDPRTPIYNVPASHPCGIQRAAIVRQCAGM